MTLEKFLNCQHCSRNGKVRNQFKYRKFRPCDISQKFLPQIGKNQTCCLIIPARRFVFQNFYSVSHRSRCVLWRPVCKVSVLLHVNFTGFFPNKWLLLAAKMESWGRQTCFVDTPRIIYVISFQTMIISNLPRSHQLLSQLRINGLGKMKRKK